MFSNKLNLHNLMADICNSFQDYIEHSVPELCTA